MKAMQFIVPLPKSRKHRALFDRDLPFRGRVEQAKNRYQRRPKHPHKDPQ